jgi:hypothetical protein
MNTRDFASLSCDRQGGVSRTKTRVECNNIATTNDSRQPRIPVTAPFTQTQRAYLNELLAQISAAGRNTHAEKVFRQ